MRPLLDALRKNIMASDRLHTDDTTVPVLKPGNKKTKTGRLWAYVRDDRPHGGADPPGVYYYYSPDRKGEHPRQHLKDFSGIIQADGYAGYKELYKPDQNNKVHILEAACWAHVRRKFYDVKEAQNSPIAIAALKRIGALYNIEREIRGEPPEIRLAARQEKSKPLLDQLEIWFHEQRARLPGKSRLAGAIRYALARWAALSFYCADGTVEIDNNAAERAMRPVALGRKNYLFAGSDAGGDRAAAFYSLIETAKLNNINPEAYLADIFSRIADHQVNKVDQLLPWNWKIQ